MPLGAMYKNISTHILTKRMTSAQSAIGELKKISTHILTKRMTELQIGYWDYFDISTHILTKRMTIPFSLILLAFLYFNSHPHEEDDSIGTMLWGANLYFNSHPHEEDDRDPIKPIPTIIISTHILTKRMTNMTAYEFDNSAISTHILTKRMTNPVTGKYDNICISTHILTKRMTLQNITLILQKLFQLTSSRRG